MGFQTAFFGDFLSLVKESYPSETIPALLLGHPVRGQPLRRFAPPPPLRQNNSRPLFVAGNCAAASKAPRFICHRRHFGAFPLHRGGFGVRHNRNLTCQRGGGPRQRWRERKCGTDYPSALIWVSFGGISPSVAAMPRQLPRQREPWGTTSPSALRAASRGQAVRAAADLALRCEATSPYKGEARGDCR